MKRWSEADINMVLYLRKHDVPTATIAERFGVTERAVSHVINKATHDRFGAPYLGYLDGPPIYKCQTREREIRNAIEGSARLLSALKYAGLSA